MHLPLFSFSFFFPLYFLSFSLFRWILTVKVSVGSSTWILCQPAVARRALTCQQNRIISLRGWNFGAGIIRGYKCKWKLWKWAINQPFQIQNCRTGLKLTIDFSFRLSPRSAWITLLARRVLSTRQFVTMARWSSEWILVYENINSWYPDACKLQDDGLFWNLIFSFAYEMPDKELDESIQGQR